MGIVTEYPLWFLIFCLIAGAAYSALLYFREIREEFSNLLKTFLAVFRFVAVSILAFLLLSPMLKSETYLKEEPVVVIAQDNSESIANTKDSSFYKKQYLEDLDRLKQNLAKKYEVREYTFGSSVVPDGKIDFSEKVTDFSLLFNELATRYYNVNVGAVILASDGNLNRGANPLYDKTRIQAPIYTLALGDTNTYRDLILYRVNHNRLAYLNNEFPLEIVVHARKASGMNTRLSVQWEGSTLFSKVIEIESDDQFIEVPVTVKAEKPGVQRYRVSLIGLSDEVTLRNNEEDVYIEVLDGRQKILILANAPHPDISALKQVIKGNMNYEVDDFLASAFDGQIEAYNLVIMHQLPSPKRNIGQILEKAAAGSVPLLFILGPQSDIRLFNNTGTGLNITSKNNSFQEALPQPEKNFTVFNLDAGFEDDFRDMPPLVAPFGEYRMSPSASVLLYQKIGNVVTGFPLVMFNPSPEQKTGVICGTGIWRWRLKTFEKEESHQPFDDFINRIIQYLSVKADKSLFRVITAKNSWYDNESVEFEAELYTESYELTDQPEVTMEIESAEGKKYPFVFGRSGGKYYLNAGNLAPGTYSYIAGTDFNGRRFTAQGQFTVQKLSVETRKTVADHNFLYSLSSATGGAMYYPASMERIAEDIIGSDTMKPVVYDQKRFTDLINFVWISVLILALLSLEWFLRKRAGSY